MDVIRTDAGNDPVTYVAAIPGTTTESILQEVKLPDTIRQDAGSDPVTLERTIGTVVKSYELHV